jgi:hypothetical protein
MRYPYPVIVQRTTLFEYVLDLCLPLGEILLENRGGDCAKHREIIRPYNGVKPSFVLNV